MTVRAIQMRLASSRVVEAAAALAGVVLVILGLLLFRVDSTTPLRWGWLQDTLVNVFPNPTNIVRGTALIVFGGILYGWSVRNAVPFNRGMVRDESGPYGLTARSRLVSFYVLLAVAAALYLVTIVLVVRKSTGLLTGGIFLAALIASVVVVARRFPPRARLFSRWELLWLTLAAVAACILYLHDAQGWLYTWVGDEWAFFDRAQSIAAGAPANLFQQDGVYGTHPVMDSVFQAATIKILGPSAFGWRVSGGIATAAGVYPIYLIGRLLSSRLVGALAVGFYLPAHVLLAYTHIGYNEPDALVPLLAAIALFLAGRLGRAPFYLFGAGVFAGVGWYTLSTARIAIALVLLGALLYHLSAIPMSRWFTRASILALARDVGFILAGFLLVLLPFLLYNGSFTIKAMANQSRVGLPGVPSVAEMLRQNTPRSLFGYVYLPQVDNHYVAGALFDTVSAFFLLLGMAALFSWKSVHSAFLLIWYWALVAANGPLYYEFHLNTTRMYIVVTAASVVAAMGASSLIDRLRSFLPAARWSRPLPAVWAAGIIAAVIAANLYLFYDFMPKQMPATPQDLAMKVIQEHPKATVVEAGALAQGPFILPQEAYGVYGRVLQATGSVSATVRDAQRQGRPVIVVSDVPIHDPGLRGRRITIWDQAHLQHIEEIVPQKTSSATG